MDAPRSNVDGRWNADHARGRFLVTPDGCLDVIWRPDGLTVLGPMRRARWVQVAPGPMRGLRLRPGRVLGWLGVSPSELVDLRLPASDFAALRDARTLEDVRACVDAARYDRRVDTVVDRLLAGVADAAPVRIDALAAAVGWSERHLRRRFTEEVGLGLARFRRIARLRRFVAQDGAARHASLTDRAAAAGYADHAHLCRDVRDLCGLAPRALSDAVSETSKTPRQAAH